MSFEELGVSSRLEAALRGQGITTPNPVQRMAIPPTAMGLDVVIHAPTGSGKTLAYLLPLIRRLVEPGEDALRRSRNKPRALIVGPTRELATQIEAVLRGLNAGLQPALVFGGVPYGGQLTALRRGPDVIIGCPGRLLDLARQGALQLAAIEYLVLDEADEMLDQGFAPDVERIIAMTPTARQTVLASATLPDWVRTMIAKHLKQPEFVHVARDVEPDLEHGLLSVDQQAKIATLDQLLQRERGQTIVFHRTKHGAKKLARDLNRLGHSAGELQGNLSQNARNRAMASFRSGDHSVLVATNVAARGIDVAEVGLVVNYELPETAEWLTHRVGRTARNGASGRALTFITPEDGPKWMKLRRQGAPNLAHVDAVKLLDDGLWAFHSGGPKDAWRSTNGRCGSVPRDGEQRRATNSAQPNRRQRRDSATSTSRDMHKADAPKPVRWRGDRPGGGAAGEFRRRRPNRSSPRRKAQAVT